MLSWLGFEGESRTQKLHMIQTLNSRSIHYIYLSIDDLRKTADQVSDIPSEAYVKPQQYRHLLTFKFWQPVSKLNEVKKWQAS